MHGSFVVFATVDQGRGGHGEALSLRPAVVGAPGQLDCLPGEARTSLVVVLARAQPREVSESARCLAPTVQVPRGGDDLLEGCARGAVVACSHLLAPQDEQCADSGPRVDGVSLRERALEPDADLAAPRCGGPVGAQRGGDAEPEVDVVVQRICERGTQVLVLDRQLAHGCDPVRADELRADALRQRGEAGRVFGAEVGCLQLERVLAHRVEHAKARYPDPRLLSPQEIRVEERGQRLELRVTDDLGGFERAPACEHRQVTQESLGRSVQELVAPVDRGAQRLLPGRNVAGAAGQNSEGLLQSR